MANEEHLKIFKQGVDAWNRWREQNPSVQPDLSRVNFWSLETSDPYLMEALWNVWLPETRSYDLRNVNLSSTNLRGACLSSADLGGAQLNCADLSFADLRHAAVKKARFHEAKLKVVKLNGLYGPQADLSSADLENSDLSGASLAGANLTKAQLKGVNFTAANLDDADLSESLLQWSLLVDLDLSQVKGLETVRHFGPSSVGMDTIERSRARIPETFLQGCGLTPLEIESVRLTVPGLDPGQVTAIAERIRASCLNGAASSCFIGFDRQDEEFARKLQADLRAHGIRCWFTPEHRTFGDPLRPALDRQRRLKEKLVVILSEESIKSEWIGEEVEAALEEEVRGNRLVVLPVRLDNAVMDARDDWAAHLKRVRRIADFRRWKENAQYQSGLEQLLRELKVGRAEG